MEKKLGKINIIFLTIIAVEATFIFTLFFQKASETKQKLSLKLELKDTAQQIQEKTFRLKELEGQLADLEKIKADQTNQIQELTSLQKVIEARMQGAQMATEMLAKQFQEQREELFKELKVLTTDSKKSQLTLVSKIESLLENKLNLRLPVAGAMKIDDTNPNTENHNADEIQLETISIPTKTQTQNKNPLEGVVLGADNAYNFVIIDLGKEKIKLNDKFMVLRKETKIGELEIKEVYDNMSVADIIAEKTIKNLRKYDRVLPLPSG